MSSFDQFDVTPSQVQQARERGEAFTLLDVREPFELAIAHVADAVAILGTLVPLVLTDMMDHPDQAYGDALYPVL